MFEILVAFIVGNLAIGGLIYLGARLYLGDDV